MDSLSSSSSSQSCYTHCRSCRQELTTEYLICGFCTARICTTCGHAAFVEGVHQTLCLTCWCDPGVNHAKQPTAASSDTDSDSSSSLTVEPSDILITDEIVLFAEGSWLSNSFISPFVFNGVTYNSAEQCFIAHMASTFGDKESEQLIMKTKSSRRLRFLSRRIRGIDKEVWNSMRCDLMFMIVRAKFTECTDLREQLVALGPKTIGFCSPTDAYWGTGCGIRSPSALRLSHWGGHSFLGYHIMAVQLLLTGSLKPEHIVMSEHSSAKRSIACDDQTHNNKKVRLCVETDRH